MSLRQSVQNAFEYIPSVSQPDRHVPFKQKLLWTAGILVAYFVLTNVPIWGLSQTGAGSDLFGNFRSILAGAQGSVLQLGIGPIVTASIVLQLLSGADLLGLDLDNPRDQQLYQSLQKVLVFAMVFITGVPLVFSGGFLPASATLAGTLGIGVAGVQLLMFIQIALGGIFIMYMDEVISKWGIGSGVGLFIVAGVAQQLFGGVINIGATWLDIATGSLELTESLSETIITVVFGPGSLLAILMTALIFYVIVYAESTRVEIPVSNARVKGARGRFPVKLIYASVLPMILVRALQANGVFEGTLSYDRVGEVLVRFLVADTDAVARTVTLPQTANPTRTQNPTLPATPPEPNARPIVQWETPIPPAEANALMGTLSTFPEVHPYYMETSFLGHDIFAMDLLPHHEARYVSQAKLNAQKPTLYLNAREDGNEVSSTSYVLRLAEQIATDPETRAYLDSVNLVIHPMSNPDGAQVAYEMQQTNPDFMLHAGYYAALGPSMDAQEDAQDPLYPEATVEPRLRHAWLPDIFMNLHGYPSHEWVQYFAGYSAWVFSRNGTARSWWPTRGYFLTGFDWIDDPDHPALRTAAFAPLDSMTAALAQLDTLMTLSRDEYARYRTYRQPEDDFGESFRNGVRVHSAIKGDELDGEHPSDVRDPRITPFSITTEAQDETARGDWLRLQARAGLTAVTAALRYLYHGENRVVREASADAGTIRRVVHREKPVLPPEQGE
jgi:preprotein translocase subunit SecY